MSEVDDAIERAATEERWPRPWTLSMAFDDRALLAKEVVRLRQLLSDADTEIRYLRRLTPPDGWAQFGTHANCKNAFVEFSEETGEDGLPLWERVTVRVSEDG